MNIPKYFSEFVVAVVLLCFSQTCHNKQSCRVGASMAWGSSCRRWEEWGVVNLADGAIQGGPNKTAHGFHCYNFVYFQRIFV